AWHTFYFATGCAHQLGHLLLTHKRRIGAKDLNAQPCRRRARGRAHEGAHRRWRIWRTGGGRAAHPERGGIRRGHHDLRGGRADGRWVLPWRQRGEWLQPTWLSVRQGISLHLRFTQVNPLRKQSIYFRHG